MNEMKLDKTNCERIIELLNDFLDGDTDEARAAEARALIEKSPQCKALYQTLMKTIELYRKQMAEMKKLEPPGIKWEDSQP
jgi:anti-sigma factor RsiW